MSTVAMFNRLRDDVNTALEKDPAARSWLEVLLLYPGVHALVFHRVSHRLYDRDLFFWARLISQIARLLTGIEIHPGATIGRGVFIDHGHGVVIGETAVIEDDVLIYHGVTLGATRSSTGKRHPTIEDGVLLGAQSTILGQIRVGHDASVAAGAVVTHTVEPHTTVAGIPAEPVEERTSTPPRRGDVFPSSSVPCCKM